MTKIQECLDAGLAFEKKMDLPSALSAYTRGIELREKDNDLIALATCYSKRGMIYARLGQEQLTEPDYAASIPYLDKAISLYSDENPIKAACYYMRGKSHFILEHWELAIADFDFAIRYYSDPNLDKESAYNLRVLAMVFCRKPELVIAEYNKIIPKQSKTYKTESYLRRAEAYQALGLHVLAEQDFLNAIHNSKEDAAILVKRFKDVTIKSIIENNTDFYHETFKHLLSEKQRALSVHKSNGLTVFSPQSNYEKDTYCGFKPGFLLGKRF